MKKGIIAGIVVVLIISACSPNDKGTGTDLIEPSVTAVSTPLLSSFLPGFSLYLAAPDVKAEQLFSLVIRDIRIANIPFLSMDDILSYSTMDYEITLSSPACQKVKQLKVPTNGKPFLVYVGNEPVYSGAFWVMFSSQSFDGIVIDTTNGCSAQSTIHTQLGYPTQDFFKGKDDRSDPRILQAFEAAGKLK